MGGLLHQLKARQGPKAPRRSIIASLVADIGSHRARHAQQAIVSPVKVAAPEMTAAPDTVRAPAWVVGELMVSILLVPLAPKVAAEYTVNSVLLPDPLPNVLVPAASASRQLQIPEGKAQGGSRHKWCSGKTASARLQGC